jgi:hypothetical protein
VEEYTQMGTESQSAQNTLEKVKIAIEIDECYIFSTSAFTVVGLSLRKRNMVRFGS